MGESHADVAYEAGGPDVIWEAFDDEVVVINLENGCYYALNEVGGIVFAQLVGGVPVGELIDGIVSGSDGELDGVSSDVQQFVGNLLEAGLLRTRTSDSPVDPLPEHLSAPASYQPPQLRAFTDMQDLLLIDPIHEVDAMGWPVRRDADAE